MGLYEYTANGGAMVPGSPSSVIEGHGGADWGSEAPVNGFAPALGLGVTLALTSIGGMNCSLPLLRDNSDAAADVYAAARAPSNRPVGRARIRNSPHASTPSRDSSA